MCGEGRKQPFLEKRKKRKNLPQGEKRNTSTSSRKKRGENRRRRVSFDREKGRVRDARKGNLTTDFLKSTHL